MNKIAIVCMLIVMCCSLLAQNSSITIGKEQDAVRAMYFEGGIAASELFGPRLARTEGIAVQGSPFLNEDFGEGEIVIRSNNPLQPDQTLKTHLRFNVYNNEFEFINKDDTLLLSKPKLIKRISIEGKEYIYTLCVPEANLIEPAFMELLAEGNVKLLKRYRCEIEQNLSVPYYMGGNGDGAYYYKTKVNYYSKHGDANAVKIPYSRNKTVKLFGNKSNKAKEKIKQAKLKLRKHEEDLVELFRYINSIN